jgi:hypothetical protein
LSVRTSSCEHFAERPGLSDVPVFEKLSPEQKLNKDTQMKEYPKDHPCFFSRN